MSNIMIQDVTSLKIHKLSHISDFIINEFYIILLMSMTFTAIQGGKITNKIKEAYKIKVVRIKWI